MNSTSKPPRLATRRASLLAMLLLALLYTAPAQAQDQDQDQALDVPAPPDPPAPDQHDASPDDAAQDDATTAEAQTDDETSQEPSLSIPEVIVGSAQTTASWDDATLRTQVIDKAQLKQRHARDLSEALRYTSGVRVETNCQSCGFTQLRLNGLRGPYTQVLIDGLPAISGLASVYGLEQLPTELIDRVEVIKGGASALYGPGAVAGVVNLRTRRPMQPFLSATIAHEQVGLKAPDLRLGVDAGVLGLEGRASAHVFAAARSRGALDLNQDGFSELTRQRQLVAGFTLNVDALPGARLRASSHVAQEHRRGGDQLDLPPHAAQIAEQLDTTRWHGELRWSHVVNSLLSYDLAYMMAYTDRRSYYGGAGPDAAGPLGPELPPPGQPLDEPERQAHEDWRAALGGYGRTQNPFHLGDARLHLAYDALGYQITTLGAQVMVDDVEDRYLGYNRVIDQAYSTMSAFAQQDWLMAPWAELVLGARLDKHSELSRPILNPRASLRLEPTSWLRLRTAVSTGFRPPQPFDEDLHIEIVGGQARQITNAPDLRPERSLSLNQQLQLRARQGGLDLELDLSLYAARLRDAFVLITQDDPDTPELDVRRVNRGQTRVVGGELNASARASWGALRAGWTLEDARDTQPDEDFNQRRLLRTPRAYGYLDGVLKRGGLQLQSGLEVTGPMLVGRYDQDGQPLQVNTSPWFFVWNTHLSYATAQAAGVTWEPFLGVRNALDSRQRDLERGPLRDSAYVYGPAQPRTIYVGLRGSL